MKTNRFWAEVVSPSMFLVLLFWGATGHCATHKVDDASRTPLGCQNVGYEIDYKVLDLLPDEAGQRNSLYFVFNALNNSINLNQMRGDESSRSVFLNHTIPPRQWAVFETNEKDVKYICTVNSPKYPYGKIVDCGQSLKICEYVNVKFGLNNRGNYWIVNGNTNKGAVGEVVRYGIIPE